MSKPPRPSAVPTFTDVALQWQAAGMAWMRWWLPTPAGADATPPAGAPALAIGRDLALTPGSVVFRNDVCELIQYAAATPRVGRRPLLFVPPCTRKYYLLDLTPETSLVRFLVGAGHTVFVVSWRAAGKGHDDGRGGDAYVEDGVLAALRVAREISGSGTVNTAGFGSGGTLLACALAVLAARRVRSVASATLLATRLDFADRDATRGSSAADEPPLPALAHWQADAAAVSESFTAWWRRRLEQDNGLIRAGALTLAGAPLDLRRITVPTYVFAARDDREVPWRAAYRATALLGGDVTFVLGDAGSAGGIVDPPATGAGRHWTNDLVTDAADDWQARAEAQPGSWWPHWVAWLALRAGAPRAAPAGPGSSTNAPLAAAPGSYALGRGG